MSDGLPPEAGPASEPSPASADPVLLRITAGSLRRAVTWVRRVLGWLTAGYLALLLVALLGLEWWGERNWLLSVFLYAPPQMLLLPLLLLTPACLLFRWRLVGWHLVALAALFFGYMTFRWSPVPAASADAVTAVTFNCGESNRPQFLAFLERENPDLIFLQDTRGRGAEVVAKFPGLSSVSLGQFAFVSKFPLGKPAVVESARWGGHPVAVRCETVIRGRPTALYSVHLPTPRRELSRFLGGRRILGDLVGNSNREPVFGDYREWLAARIELARALADVLAQEPLPMIVGGDFNTPDHGYIYRLFAGRMTDAFARAGRGWGLTFPGSTRNPIAFFGPWLRLDYFFVGPGWEVTECRPEPGRKSQHKAVFARFEPRPIH